MAVAEEPIPVGELSYTDASRELNAIVVVGTGGQTASLADTVREAAQAKAGPDTPADSQTEQRGGKAAQEAGHPDLSQMTEEQRLQKIKDDAAAVLTQMAAEAAGEVKSQVDAAGADARATLAGAPQERAKVNPTGVVNTINASQNDTPA